MPIIKAGVLAVLIFLFLGENRTILNDVAACILGVESASLFDLVAYYALLIYTAYGVFCASDHFAKEYYDGSKRYPKVSQYLSALLASFVVAIIMFGMSEEARGQKSDHVRNVAQGLKIFAFVATFSSFGVLCAHRREC